MVKKKKGKIIIDPNAVSSEALKRILAALKEDDNKRKGPSGYNRTHNRHNRSAT